MSDDVMRFELTASLSVMGVARDVLEDYAKVFESAFVEAIAEYPSVRAYFVTTDIDAIELNIGLRFENAKPKYIEEMANEIVENAVKRASESGTVRKVVREESTLVPA